VGGVNNSLIILHVNSIMFHIIVQPERSNYLSTFYVYKFYRNISNSRIYFDF